MPLYSLLERYLDLEWHLTWFPITAGAALSAPQHRGNHHVYKSTDPALTANNSIGVWIGNGTKGDGDPLPDPPRVMGLATIGLDADGAFQVNLELQVGGAIRKKYVPLAHSGTTPFMINVHAVGEDRIVHGTAATLHGVFTTGPRAATVLSAVARAFGP
jgi:hypothetical protein